MKMDSKRYIAVILAVFQEFLSPRSKTEQYNTEKDFM